MYSSTNAEPDYYIILGIGRNASKKEIKQAYRRMAMKYHPDKNNGSKSCEIKFKAIVEAREALLNSELSGQDEIQAYDDNEMACEREGLWGSFNSEAEYVADCQAYFDKEDAEYMALPGQIIRTIITLIVLAFAFNFPSESWNVSNRLISDTLFWAQLIYALLLLNHCRRLSNNPNYIIGC